MSTLLAAVTLHPARGADVRAWLDALAALRLEVFREWPYLYDGDLAYERAYLEVYARSPRSLVVVAERGGQVIGATTCLPLSDETAELRAPFEAQGLDPREVLYFGESVVRREHRGLGLGGAFFDERERHAAALGGVALTTFCAVDRAADDPRRPTDARSPEGLWRRRGYTRRPELTATLEWPEVGSGPRAHTLTFWTRAAVAPAPAPAL